MCKGRILNFPLPFLIIKPTRCTDFSNLFLERNSTCFRQFFCPSSGVFHRTHSLQAVSKPVWHIPLLYVQWKTPDDGQRNCPKHVEFYSKNKIEWLVHLVGFIKRIHHDERSHERQISSTKFYNFTFTIYIVITKLRRSHREDILALHFTLLLYPVFLARWWSLSTETFSYVKIQRTMFVFDGKKYSLFHILYGHTGMSSAKIAVNYLYLLK